MKYWKPILCILLFTLSLLLVFGAPYAPNALFLCLYDSTAFDYHTFDVRFSQVIPCIKTAGALLSAWGIALLMKK